MKFTFKLILVLVCTSSWSFAQISNYLIVGDKAPVLSPFQWLKGTPISDYKKGTIYIIEFGATWCRPCKEMIPVLSSLQEKYRKHVAVASLFVMEQNTNKDKTLPPSYLPKVVKYIEKQSNVMQYSIGVDDAEGSLYSTWIRGSNRSAIPFTVVIDKKGIIAWMGSNPTILTQIVTDLVNGEPILKKTDIPKFLRGSELMTMTSTEILYTVKLAKAHGRSNEYSSPYIQSYLWADSASKLSKLKGKIQASNKSLLELYYMAYGDTLWNQVDTRDMYTNQYPDTIKYPHLRKSYGKFFHIPIYEGNDISALNERYDYYLEFSKTVFAKDLKEKMQSDLADNFDYHVSVEDRDVPCWILTVESSDKFNKTKSTSVGVFSLNPNPDGSFNFVNAEVRDIIWILGSTYGFRDYDYNRLDLTEQGAFIDRTNYKGAINFTAKKSFSFEEFNHFLKGIGLKLSKGSKRMKVVVIRDTFKS